MAKVASLLQFLLIVSPLVGCQPSDGSSGSAGPGAAVCIGGPTPQIDLGQPAVRWSLTRE